MIRSFRHRGLKHLYSSDDPSGIRPDLVPRIRTILTVLDAASHPRALDLPGFRLHPLKGKRLGEWAIAVNANWRVVFSFEGKDAVDVDLIDYH